MYKFYSMVTCTTKCSVCLSFVDRYSHEFNVVSSCHTADDCLDWTWWNDSLATTIT